MFEFSHFYKWRWEWGQILQKDDCTRVKCKKVVGWDCLEDKSFGKKLVNLGIKQKYS